jgi:hypothetical protein
MMRWQKGHGVPYASRSSFTMEVYQHVLPGMGEQVASAIETALGASE